MTPKEYFDNTRIMSLVKNAVDGLIKNVETGPLKVRNKIVESYILKKKPFFFIYLTII
jgi:hypothetical protein